MDGRNIEVFFRSDGLVGWFIVYLFVCLVSCCLCSLYYELVFLFIVIDIDKLVGFRFLGSI